MSSEVILTPGDDGDVVELSRTHYRKRVLPKGSINYKGRKIVFDDAYLSSLVTSFKDGAYDHVPVQLADAENKHNLDPERFGGEVVGLELADDGLWATLSVTERGAKLIGENPKLGVSAALRNHYERSDGKSYDAAMNHLLLTLDPRVPNLGAWTGVDLSGYDGEDSIIDLSNSQFEGDSAVADDNDKVSDENVREALKTLGCDEQEIEEFLASVHASEEAAAEQDKADEDTETTAETDDGEDETGQEQKPETDEADEDTQAEDKNEDTEAADKDKVLEGAGADLSNAADEELRSQLAAVRKQLATSRFEAEKAKWVGQGVPPAFIDLSREILTAPEGEFEVNLSNDDEAPVNAADVIRKMIDLTAGYVKVAEAQGHNIALSNDDDQESKENEELANVWDQIAARKTVKKN